MSEVPGDAMSSARGENGRHPVLAGGIGGTLPIARIAGEVLSAMAMVK